ncbi:MAG: hypothetical protein KG003_06305 [Bacteroidetes bacterium]|nr:hypothetical protein [Bacteroidota bacterium]
MIQESILQFLFILTTTAAVWFFFKSMANNALVLIFSLLVGGIQAALVFGGFFENTKTLPPHIALAPALFIIPVFLLFLTRKGREFFLSADLKFLTWLHLVRVPVEATLYFLYQSGEVPKLMTFEGANPDILSGITAPIAVIFLYRKGNIKRIGLLLWNLVCLALLANIVSRAVFSVPSPIQQLAFDQPNVAVLKFPYVWLPGIVVPLVLLSHVISIWKLLRKPA